MVAGIHPIGVHGAQILNLKLEKGTGELLGEAESLGESIGLELKLARKNVHGKLNDKIHGGQGVGEENEANDDGVLSQETESRIQRVVVDEDGEESKDVEEMGLINS